MSSGVCVDDFLAHPVSHDQIYNSGYCISKRVPGNSISTKCANVSALRDWIALSWPAEAQGGRDMLCGAGGGLGKPANTRSAAMLRLLRVGSGLPETDQPTTNSAQSHPSRSSYQPIPSQHPPPPPHIPAPRSHSSAAPTRRRKSRMASLARTSAMAANMPQIATRVAPARGHCRKPPPPHAAYIASVCHAGHGVLVCYSMSAHLNFTCPSYLPP